jgi:hypothetical protein
MFLFYFIFLFFKTGLESALKQDILLDKTTQMMTLMKMKTHMQLQATKIVTRA